MSRRRLDQELVRRGLAESRARAVELVDSGLVRVGGIPAPRPATLVDVGASIEVGSGERPYASRGGIKLEGAMTALGIDVAGRRALDAGASTGGFTDFLLRHGVAEVVALDVGRGQLEESLRRHPGVRVFDRTNLRHVTSETLGGRFGLVVADLSFISLCTVAETLAEVSEPGADLVLLVKPQFEVGKGRVGKGGVVRDPRLWREAVDKVADCLASAGIGVRQVVASPIAGAKGNREFFVWGRRGELPGPRLVMPAELAGEANGDNPGDRT